MKGILPLLLLLQDISCMNSDKRLQNALHSIRMSKVCDTGVSIAHTTYASLLFVEEYSRPKRMRQLAPFVANEFVTLDARLVQGFLETFISWYFDFLVAHPHILRILGWEIGDQWKTFLAQPAPVQEARQLAAALAFLRRAQEAGFIRAEINVQALLVSMGAPWDQELVHLKRHVIDLLLDRARPHP